MNRRDFLKNTGLVGAGLSVLAPSILNATITPTIINAEFIWNEILPKLPLNTQNTLIIHYQPSDLIRSNYIFKSGRIVSHITSNLDWIGIPIPFKLESLKNIENDSSNFIGWLYLIYTWPNPFSSHGSDNMLQIFLDNKSYTKYNQIASYSFKRVMWYDLDKYTKYFHMV